MGRFREWLSPPTVVVAPASASGKLPIIAVPSAPQAGRMSLIVEWIVADRVAGVVGVVVGIPCGCAATAPGAVGALGHANWRMSGAVAERVPLIRLPLAAIAGIIAIRARSEVLCIR